MQTVVVCRYQFRKTKRNANDSRHFLEQVSRHMLNSEITLQNHSLQDVIIEAMHL